MKKQCTKCGALLGGTESFCNTCKTAVNSVKANKNIEKSILNTNVIEKVLSNNITASAFVGESALGQGTSIVGNDILSEISPLKFLFGEAKRFVQEIIASFKDIKKLIPTIVLAVIWIVLILLPKIGVNPIPVQILSFLTFAQGGISNDPFRMFGGLVGKGLYAYLITLLVIPVTMGQNPFKSIASGLKSSVEQYKNMDSNLVLLLTGAGIALIFYNFMAGYASPWKSMAAVTAMLLTLRSVANNSGFLTRFLNSLLNKIKKPVNEKNNVKNIISGMSAGFALSIPISAIPYVYICYALGVVMIIASVILLIVKNSKKEAK